MKSTEFITEDNTNKGTYAGMKFDEDTIKKMLTFAKEKNIPNVLDPQDFHTTLLYSRKHLPNYKPLGKLETPIIGFPVAFEVWESPPNAFKEEATRCLVLKYSCQEQEDRFNELMDEHEATYDYDEYKPHTTFSYDIGPDFDETDLDASTIGELKLIEEYAEELNLNKTYE